MPQIQVANWYKAIVAYDGTDFQGFQVQTSDRTVQGTLEAALTKIAKYPIRVIGAGRTDAGVHAVGQVISFKLPWRHTLDDLSKALNVNLPPEVVIAQLTKVAGNFHPRFDALSRQYRYTVLNQPVRDVFKRRYATLVSGPIDVALMQQASLYLLGRHDFTSFGRPPQGDNAVRMVTQASWSTNGTEIIFEITANAFLYRMVRNIVGTLLQVGLRQLEGDKIKNILLAKDRSQAGVPASPNGLCLMSVNY